MIDKSLKGGNEFSITSLLTLILFCLKLDCFKFNGLLILLFLFLKEFFPVNDSNKSVLKEELLFGILFFFFFFYYLKFYK